MKVKRQINWRLQTYKDEWHFKESDVEWNQTKTELVFSWIYSFIVIPLYLDMKGSQEIVVFFFFFLEKLAL